MSTTNLTRGALRASIACQLTAAAILGQTLYFKFSGAEALEDVARLLGVEPWGRLGSGVAELACVLLLLLPRTAVYGALLSLAVISGALGSHLFVLGIEVRGDGGLLFGLALAVFAASAAVVALRRAEFPVVGRRFRPA